MKLKEYGTPGARQECYYVDPLLVKAPQLQSMVIYIFFKFGIIKTRILYIFLHLIIDISDKIISKNILGIVTFHIDPV